MSDVEIRDAATVILVRDRQDAPKVLMGQRGKQAAFMPDKFVFPGGAVDLSDKDVTLATYPSQTCMTRMENHASADVAAPLIVAGIRELWEETGLRLQAQDAGNAAEPWSGFEAPAAGHGLRYIFRAITPPGRPRRFDARFLLRFTDDLDFDLDDFSDASDELSHLHWVGLKEARALDLPFITEVVLAEVQGLLAHDGSPPSVPFFKNDTETSQFLRIF